jgi:hypothetical protein
MRARTATTGRPPDAYSEILATPPFLDGSADHNP